MGMRINIKEFKIIGCRTPSEENPQPQLFFANIFAPSRLIARSKFNKLMRTQQKIKSSSILIASIEEIAPESEKIEVETYGINFKYQSIKGVHNMYKEVRAISRPDAVATLHQIMAGTHHAKSSMIEIIELRTLTEEEMKRSKSIEYQKKGIEVPVFKKVSRNRRVTVAPKYAKVFY